MICGYGKGECSRRAVFRVSGEYEDDWGDSHWWSVNVCVLHNLHFDSCERGDRVWIGGNWPPEDVDMSLVELEFPNKEREPFEI
jgi:hypothetical protein